MGEGQETVMGQRAGQRALSEARMILAEDTITLGMRIEARVLLERACWELEGAPGVAAEALLELALRERAEVVESLRGATGAS